VRSRCFLCEAATGNEKSNRQGRPDDAYQREPIIAPRKLKELVPVMEYSKRHPNRYKKQEPCFCEMHETHKAAMLYHWFRVSLYHQTQTTMILDWVE
jgi:hypothetical protein